MCKFAFVSLLVGFAAAAQVPASTPTKIPANVQTKVPVNLPNRNVKKVPGGVSLRSPIESEFNSRNERQIITTKFSWDGTPEKQCECVDLLWCIDRNSFDLVANGNADRCQNENHTCCEIKLNNVEADQGFVSGGISKTEAAPSNPSEKPCSCVAFDQCHNEAYVKDYGAGTIEIRISPCDTTQICCPDEYLSSPNPPVVTEASHGGFTNYPPAYPDTNSENHVHVSEDPHKGFSSFSTEHVINGPTEPSLSITKTTPNPEECACVPFAQCKNDTYDQDYGRGIILVRSQFCDISELCCPIDYIIKAAPLSYPPTSNSNKPVPEEEHYECGIRKETSVRISTTLDKISTDFGEFPWMIMILKKSSDNEKQFTCGGSLLSTRVVLTAAHCVKGIDKDLLVVRAGEYDVHLDSSSEPAPDQDRLVHNIIIHPFYHSDVLFNDMALIIVKEPFVFKSHIAPICVPLLESKFADSNIYNPENCIATGWGKDLHGPEGSFQTTLKKVDLQLVDHEECEKKLKKSKLGPRFKLHASLLCAGGQLGKDTCQGDGGGPLFCALHENPNRFVQVGIVSWGVGCGDQYPAVYTNLYANKKWLSVELNLLNSSPDTTSSIDIRKTDSTCGP